MQSVSSSSSSSSSYNYSRRQSRFGLWRSRSTEQSSVESQLASTFRTRGVPTLGTSQLGSNRSSVFRWSTHRVFSSFVRPYYLSSSPVFLAGRRETQDLRRIRALPRTSSLSRLGRIAHATSVFRVSTLGATSGCILRRRRLFLHQRCF